MARFQVRRGAGDSQGEESADTMRATLETAEKIETRLALVMNGGVSLAVWMGGVAHELDLLRRASDGATTEDQVPERDREVFILWKQLADKARRRVQVDVVSGTSAGGLNGILLATAIGRGAALPSELRDLWVKSASLDHLKEGTPKNSLLSGDQLAKYFRKALDAINKSNPTNRVTLFVTATALNGRGKALKDTFGQSFGIRDHRRVYKFKSQPDYKYNNADGKPTWSKGHDRNDFERDCTESENALVHAARATASFPVAFSPISEDLLTEYRLHPDPGYKHPASNVMDGGVLNNAPFGPVLEEITKRPAAGPVERVVVYVVPTSGRLAEEYVKNKRPEEITPLTAAWSALFYPQEADVRSGTEDLHNRLNTSVRETREELFDRLLDPNEGEQFERRVRLAASNLLPEYRWSRARAVVLDAMTERTHPETITPLVTPPEADAKAIEDILGRRLSWLPLEGVQELNDPDLDMWRWGCRPAERLLQTLSHQLHEMLLKCFNDSGPIQSQRQKTLIEGIRDITEQLQKMIALSDATSDELAHWPSPGERMSERVAADVVEQVFTKLDVPGAAGKLVDEATACFLRTLREVDPSARWRRRKDVVSAYLIVEVLTQAFAPPIKVVDKLTPKFRFLRLGPDAMGPLFNQDWSADIGDKKLYGIRIHHFGAFIHEDWRKSDFTWGRLDAAHHLLPLLLPDTGNEELEKKLHQAILQSEGTSVKRVNGDLEKLVGCSDAQLLYEVNKGLEEEAGKQLLRLMKNQPSLKGHPLRRWAFSQAWARLWKRSVRNWRKHGEVT
ncbi:DUF3376 domain-containing protein [Streptomyces sp. N2A]|uniref:DUF3376 domain-containing protein n=1 Tax=Streptomyces sp. N2A TaxID=3073936 RepID=UPI00286FEB04|nr:DUF3376 domain-containing protein [Streptomyces sp. N2A]